MGRWPCRSGGFARAFLSVMLAVALLPVAPVASGALPIPRTYYVNPVAGSDTTGTGSAALPFRSITHAMTLSGAQDHILCAPGTYSTASGEHFPILVNNGVCVKALQRRTAWVEGDGNAMVFAMQGAGQHTELNGLVMLNGSTIGDGGGIAISRITTEGPLDAGWPRILDCAVWNCSATGSGGGISVQTWTTMSPLIEGCEILGNLAKVGAGVYAYKCAPTIRHCIVSSNGNSLTTAGGGIAVSQGRGGEISGNHVSGNTGYRGAGLEVDFSLPLMIEDNMFSRNRVATGGFGAVYIRTPSSVQVLSQNRVVDSTGGRTAGMDLLEGAFLTKSNLIGGNRTGEANAVGGLSLHGAATLDSRNDSVLSNEATGAGAAWNGVKCADATMTMVNGVLWNPLPGLSTAASSEDATGAAFLTWTTVRDTDLSGPGVSHAFVSYAGAGPVGFDGRQRYGAPVTDSATHTAASANTDVRHVQRPQDGDGNGPAWWDRGAFEVRPPAMRVSGTNRYAAAYIVALQSYPAFAGVSDVVIACGDDRAVADPLAAAGLCWLYDAPLLLTSATTLTAETRAAFVQLASPARRVIRVHVVGGTASVPQARLDEIAAICGPGVASFDRAAGIDRYEVATKIAERMVVDGPVAPKRAVLIANGADTNKFFDALALAAIARSQGSPILLVRYGSIPPVTQQALDHVVTGPRFIGGGSGTVAESVRTALGATRWAGIDRYATAVAIANGAKARGYANFASVGVASGTSGLYDALVGGPMVGRDGGVLLLTKPWEFSPSTASALTANHGAIAECFVFGTSASVSETVRAKIKANVK